MPMSVWFGVKFTPGKRIFHDLSKPIFRQHFSRYLFATLSHPFSGGHSTFFGLLNTFIHILMYTYYLLAAMGPKLQPYLWWKKYLTVFQMIQFIAVMIHAFQLLFINCNYPKAFVWWIGLHATMFFFLFNEFYQKSYQQKQKKKLAAKGMKQDRQQNHQTNGVANGSVANPSGRRDAADYYVKGDSLAASELNLRKSYTMAE